MARQQFITVNIVCDCGAAMYKQCWNSASYIKCGTIEVTPMSRLDCTDPKCGKVQIGIDVDAVLRHQKKIAVSNKE